MAPLRNNRASNRANRVQTEHDVMEGLPVRQWRKQPTAVSTAPPRDPAAAHDPQNARWTELPMPRGAELYPPWCQSLLRAARRGVVKPPSTRPAGEDDKDGAGGGDDEDADGDDEGGFTSARWTQVPKDLEQPEQEFLAKRRKGLPSLYGVAAVAAAVPGSGMPMRKTKVKKVDAEGRVSVYEVLAPEGTTVEGEVLDGEEVMVEAAVPGTVVEGVGVVNAEGVVVASEQVVQTPPRRRPPPPKRKPKGPGRGRKKKVVIESAGRMAGVPVEPSTAAATDGGIADGNTLSAPGTAIDGADATKVKEESVTREGEEGSEEEDDEGDEGDDADREDGEILEPGTTDATPSKPPPTAKSPPPTVDLPVPRLEEPAHRDASSSPDVPLAATQALSPGLKPNAPASEAFSPPIESTESDVVLPSEPTKMPVKMEMDSTEPMTNDTTMLSIEQSATVPLIDDSSNAGAPLPGLEGAVPMDDAMPPSPPQQQPMEETLQLPVDPMATGTSVSETSSLSVLEAIEPPRDLLEPLPPASAPAAPVSLPGPEAIPVADPSFVEAADSQPPPVPSGETAAPVTPVAVEEPSATEPEAEVAKAEIPAEHNPLDGLAAPREPMEVETAAESVPEASKNEPTAANDGEEDIFGDLEAHLNKGAGDKK